MDHFIGVAYYESIWRGTLAIVIAVLLIVFCASGISSALQIGAHVALLFAVLMIRNAFQLARMLSESKSTGASMERWTQIRPSMLMLQFAQAGTVVAIGLSGAALLT
jgi:hypothetical protein